MKKIFKGFSYSFLRNIGWQDRTIRTIVGIGATVGAFYFLKTNSIVAIALAVLAVAQFWTVLSARCIICFFIGQCTISTKERNQLSSKGIEMENSWYAESKYFNSNKNSIGSWNCVEHHQPVSTANCFWLFPPSFVSSQTISYYW